MYLSDGEIERKREIERYVEKEREVDVEKERLIYLKRNSDIVRA